MLSNEELLRALEEIKKKLYAENTGNNAEYWLAKIGIIGFSTKQDAEYQYNINPKGKILIIGATDTKLQHLEGMIKQEFGLDNLTLRKRFVFILDYEGWNKKKGEPYKTEYSAILAGPAPHSASGKEADSSIIRHYEKNEEGIYAPLYKLGSNGLFISKSNVKEKLKQLVAEGVIEF